MSLLVDCWGACTPERLMGGLFHIMKADDGDAAFTANADLASIQTEGLLRVVLLGRLSREGKEPGKSFQLCCIVCY
jgi:hypothetical protein